MSHLVSTHSQLRGDVPWGLEHDAAISCRDNNQLESDQNWMQLLVKENSRLPLALMTLALTASNLSLGFLHSFHYNFDLM